MSQETLADAIEREGFQSEGGTNFQQQLNMLSEHAKNLTKDQIFQSLNGESVVDEDAITSIKGLVRARLANGQHVLPWNVQSELKPLSKNHVLTGW